MEAVASTPEAASPKLQRKVIQWDKRPLYVPNFRKDLSERVRVSMRVLRVVSESECDSGGVQFIKFCYVLHAKGLSGKASRNCAGAGLKPGRTRAKPLQCGGFNT